MPKKDKDDVVVVNDMVIPAGEFDYLSIGELVVDFVAGGSVKRKKFGVPLGLITTVTGLSKSGKTGLCMSLLKTTQAYRPDVATRYYAVEPGGVNTRQAEQQGIDCSSIHYPKTTDIKLWFEDLSEFIRSCAKNKQPGLFILDSVHLLTAPDAIDKKADDFGKGYGTQRSKIFNEMLASLVTPMLDAKVALVTITHQKENFERSGPYAPKYSQKISEAQNFMHRVNLEVSRKEDITVEVDGKKERVGMKAKIKALKAQYGTIKGTCEIAIYDNYGICPFTTNLEFLYTHDESGGKDRLVEIFGIEKKDLTTKRWLNTQITTLRDMAGDEANAEYITETLISIYKAVYKTWVKHLDLMASKPNAKNLSKVNSPQAYLAALQDD